MTLERHATKVAPTTSIDKPRPFHYELIEKGKQPISLEQLTEVLDNFQDAQMHFTYADSVYKGKVAQASVVSTGPESWSLEIRFDWLARLKNFNMQGSGVNSQSQEEWEPSEELSHQVFGLGSEFFMPKNGRMQYRSLQGLEVGMFTQAQEDWIENLLA